MRRGGLATAVGIAVVVRLVVLLLWWVMLPVARVPLEAGRGRGRRGSSQACCGSVCELFRTMRTVLTPTGEALRSHRKRLGNFTEVLRPVCECYPVERVIQLPAVFSKVPRSAFGRVFTVLVYWRARNSLGRATGSSGSLGLYYMSLLRCSAGWELIYTIFQGLNEFAITPMSLQRVYSLPSAHLILGSQTPVLTCFKPLRHPSQRLFFLTQNICLRKTSPGWACAARRRAGGFRMGEFKAPPRFDGPAGPCARHS